MLQEDHGERLQLVALGYGLTNVADQLRRIESANAPIDLLHNHEPRLPLANYLESGAATWAQARVCGLNARLDVVRIVVRLRITTIP